MKIAFVGAMTPEHEGVCTHWTGIHAAFSRMPEHEHRLFCCRSDKHYVENIIGWKPDVIIYNLLDLAENQQARERLRDETNAKIVFWYGDARDERTGQITCDISGTVDLFLCSNDGLHDFNEKHFGMRSQFMPLAAEPVAERKDVSALQANFIFIGGRYSRKSFQERADIVLFLQKEAGLKVIHGETPVDKAKVYKMMPELYGSAHFSLDISHFWDIEKYSSNRFWVIPAMYGLPVTRRFPGCEALVPEDIHIYWDDIDDLRRKIEYFYRNPDRAERMRHEGWLYAHQNTYQERIEQILYML